MLGAGLLQASALDPSVRELLEHPGSVQLRGSAAELFDADAVRRFYQGRDFQPAWTGPGCQVALQTLVGAIEDAESHGLHSRDYHLEDLLGPDHCDATRELLATDAWLALAAHLYAGRVDPLTVEPDWTATRPSMDSVALLEQALAAGDVAGTLDRLASHDPLYVELRKTLTRFRGYAAIGRWTGVDAGPTLRLGDTGIRVAQLRVRLRLSGLLGVETAAESETETEIQTEIQSAGFIDTETNADTDAIFDENLEAAVRAFQRRANLEPDGVVGTLTLLQLSHRASDRIDQIRANLERLRWLPDEMGRRNIRVNIADFQLEAWADGAIVRVHQVIVGQLYRRTPSFSGKITHLVLSPWWEVPRSLALRDKLPLFKRDSSAVTRAGYVVVDREGDVVSPTDIDWKTMSSSNFPYRLRQRPGPKNALGAVKFMFPNKHNVYLHDTSSPALFSRVRRSFSSGCIRVESALDLAQWLLEPMPEWTRERIDAAAIAGTERTVLLAEPVAVHLLYLTAVFDGNGGVRFVDDIYLRDPALIAALDRAPPLAKK